MVGAAQSNSGRRVHLGAPAPGGMAKRSAAMRGNSECRIANSECGRVHLGTPAPPRRGFTLAEMVVVMAVILILTALLLPAVRTIWYQHKVADAENIIKGLLTTTRPRAMAPGGGESGLFFMLDAEGVQHIYSITQQPVGQLEALNQFVLTSEREYALPAPMRVVPRYAVEVAQQTTDEPYTFSAAELASNAPPWNTRPMGVNEAQRHRNFFTMVYSNEGQLEVWRDVLIKDEDADEDGRGDITGLRVADGEANQKHDVAQYYDLESGAKTDIDDITGLPLQDLLTDEGDVALNFPSVDGLLVYDDSLFNEVEGTQDRRAFLLRAAQPFYVSGLSGAVVRGPMGENE